MKRLTRHLAAVVALALAGIAGAAVAAAFWVATTTHGTSWFLRSASSLSGGSFSVQKIEGRIIDHLLLTGVRIGQAQLKVDVDTLELLWKPLLLATGTAAVQEVNINGVRIQDDMPSDNKPPVLVWPKMPRIVQLFDGNIARLRVTLLSYRYLREQPMLVTSIAGSVSWQNGLLTIGSFKAESPSGRIGGSASAGFNRPSLSADLAVAPVQPVAGMDSFSLRVSSSSGRGAEQIVAMAKVSGSANDRKLLELSGDAGMTRDALNLRRLRLTSTERRGLISADGSLSFKTVEPVLSLQIKATGLDLPELNVPTDISGILKFTGTLDSYRGEFNLTNKAQGWQAATASGAYHGTSEGIKLAPLSVRALDGTLSGNLDMDWRDGFALRGTINGRNLNPGRFDPGWKGVANFNADGNLAVAGKEPVKGSVKASILESSLHGQALTGELQASFAGSNLSLARLNLQGKGFDLQASGELNRRLNLSARISDFSRLVPGAAGTLTSGGWVRWSDGHLAGSVTGTGGDLAYEGDRIAAVSLTARLEQGPGYPLHVAASLRDLVHGGYTLNSVTVAADGTLQHHAVNASLRSNGNAAQLALSAGYDSGLWKGEITRFTGNDGAGPWNLAAPASFAASAEKFFLSPLTLTSGAAERLEAAADLALKPLSGKLRAQWSGMNLARANSFLKEGRVSGSSNGTVKVGILSGKRLTVVGSVAGSGAFTDQGHSITIKQSLVTFDGNEQGIKVGVDLSEAGGGRLSGTFSSSAPLRMALPVQGVLGGELKAEASGIDLALFKPWLPKDTSVDGRISSLILSAGYKGGLWKGEITGLTGSDASGPWNLAAPAAFAVSAEKFFLSPLAVTSETGEHLEVAADLALKPLSGKLRVQWNDLNLARANSFLKEGRLSGSSRGTVQASILPGKRLALSGSVAGSGTFAGQGYGVSIARSMITFDGGEKGMRVDVELVDMAGGRLSGTFTSPAPLRMAIPEKGELKAEVSGIDLALLKPWLPKDISVEGRIKARAQGTLLPGQHFDLQGDAALSGGMLHQDLAGGEPNLTFTSATVSWKWREDALTGDILLAMADYGQATANFQLPVPARFPVAVDPMGPLRAAVAGQFKEHGIVSALFPGLVRDSFGELDAELSATGSWEVPVIAGKLRLIKAGAYLPAAGIHLKDIQLTAHLEKNLILIDAFRALSGPGHIEGNAQITLAGWQLIGYRGELRGENFQTVHFPELELLSTPNLRFDGTPEKLSLRGELRLPELRVTGAPPRTANAPSGDVVLEGRAQPLAKSSPVALDVQIRVLLGDRVFVKAEGIDAQLGGFMDLTLSRLDRITSTGEIKVVKGSFRTYGVNLDIVRGRLYFAGDTIERPTLDVLAQRTIGDVRAGVTVSGTLQHPVTKLYSVPPMPDVDILAYIVLGHPIGSNEQANRMSMAATALLTSSQSAELQDKLKGYLGLSTMSIQEGVGGNNGAMGYKPLQVTPPGAIPAMQQPGVTQTMFTVGKYITPELYISYGRSLFTGSNQFLLRYDIFRNWQIETQTGSESGADLFYKLEFK